MPENSRVAVTQLLIQWSSGDEAAFRELVPAVEDELRRIATRLMRKERSGHTLQTTALVNEAYLRLVDQDHVDWRNRAHFVGIAARIMRQILIDHGRRAQRRKRGGGQPGISLDEALLVSDEKSGALLALDEALTRLGSFDTRKAQVVELRYFGGLSVEETAEVLQVHHNTVIRDWALAKAWLRKELECVS